jgi:hypothetical protein
MSYHQNILHAIARTKYLGKAALSRPFSCQIFMVPSEDPEAKKRWSGDTARRLTAAVCSLSAHMSVKGGGGDREAVADSGVKIFLGA